MTPALAPALAQLSPAEKLLLVEELWDQLTQSGLEFPLSAAQRAELQAERDAIRRNPRDGSTWSDAKKRILSQK